MDWTTILKAQQTDFIQRLKSGDLLHCEKEGQHSELKVISGERLKQLRNFCWEMANKFKQQYDVKNIFFNNMKGKLGEEVVKIRLGDFVTKVDYEKRIGGDGKIDFTLTSDSSIGIQVKTRYGNCDQVQWTIDREEIEKNSVLVCILCQEEFSDMEKEYGLIIAGFLPTNMIKSAANEAIVGIDELLYPGGLRGYLESFIFHKPNDYINSGYDLALIYDQQAMACRESKDYLGALSNYNKAIFSNPNISAIYNNRGLIHEALGNTQSAIDDYTQALLINPSLTEAYYNRGNIRNNLGDTQGAIDDYTQALLINPADTELYYKRGLAHSYLGDKQAAISDYTRAIKLDSNYIGCLLQRAKIRFYLGYKLATIEDLNTIIEIVPNEVDAYFIRANIYYILGLYEDAIADYTQAIEILPTHTYAYYNRGLARSNSGDKQGAIEDFTHLIKLDPHDLDNHIALAQAKNIQDAKNEFDNKEYESEENNESCQCTSDLNPNLSELDNLDLISAVGMDYRKLRDLVKTGKWIEADEETRRIMLTVAKREEEGYLDTNSIDNFPCEDLRTIDYLWVKYSNGKFGFSVQKIIYQGLAKTYDSKMWDQFIHKIGRYIYYEINESNYINPPEGYFPGSVGVIWLGWEEGVGYEFVEGWFDDYLFRHLVRRLEICKMYNIKSEKIYEPLTKHNTQVSDDYKDNYPTEDLNNNDDYDDYFDDSYQEEYDDMYYSKDMQRLDDYRSSDYGYLEDFDQSSFYDYFN